MKEDPKPSQWRAILAHLKAGHKLTCMDSLTLFGCNRLAARIDEIHRHGHRTEREMIKLPSGKHVAQYSIPTQS